MPRRKQHLLKFYDSCQTVKITARHKLPPSLIFSQIFVSLFSGADMPETPGPALLHARLPDCEGGLPGSEFPEPRSNFVITFPPLDPFFYRILDWTRTLHYPPPRAPNTPVFFSTGKPIISDFCRRRRYPSPIPSSTSSIPYLFQ